MRRATGANAIYLWLILPAAPILNLAQHVSAKFRLAFPLATTVALSRAEKALAVSSEAIALLILAAMLFLLVWSVLRRV